MGAMVFVPKTISEFLTEVSMIDDISMKLSKLKDYVHVLEDELKKIDAFKRELPLCMDLLTDAIERLKEETKHCEGKNDQPVIEEFIQLKSNFEEDQGAKQSNDSSDKKNWMNSVQLWSTPFDYENSDAKKQDLVFDLKSISKEEEGSVAKNSHKLCNIRNRGGAFVAYKEQSVVPRQEEHKEISSVHGLSLSIPVVKKGAFDLNLKGDCSASSFDSSHSSKPQKRKERRCWSPELHRRFVNALHQLGGAQVATPKQIRDLMQVDGLTNDEVKSHLQKYRLHVRKFPVRSSSAPSNGCWIGQDQCGAVSSGSSEGPLVLAGSAKGVSFTAGESMEDDEDEKSDIRSWNGRLHKLGDNAV